MAVVIRPTGTKVPDIRKGDTVVVILGKDAGESGSSSGSSATSRAGPRRRAGVEARGATPGRCPRLPSWSPA